MTVTSDLRTQAVRVAGSVDPDTMTGAQAVAAVEDLAIADKATAATLLFMALRVARTDAWQNQGYRSAADWLAAKLGVSVNEAHRQLRTARNAENLSNTRTAMANGELSPDQADAVADAATADPAAEDDLLDTAANDTNRHLRERAAARKAAATDTATREKRIRNQRSVRRYTDADGAFNLHLRGPAADGVQLEALLRPHEEDLFHANRRNGTHHTHENRSYDALINLLLGHNHATAANTGPTAADPAAATPTAPASAPAPLPAAPPVKLPGGNNIKVIVRIDHTALTRGHTIAGETCHVAGLGPIPVTTAKSLMTDAFLAAVITKGRDVINVAHLGRALNARQRTAIEALGLRCTNIACNQSTALQIDHRTPYATNPETHLDNQDPLCPHCHRLKTHHGYHLEPGHGPRKLLPPHPSDNPRPDREPRPDRPLTDEEADQLEARLRTRLAQRAIPTEQPTLC